MINIPTNLPQEILDKYNLVNNTFIRKDKGEVNAEREVEIGDVHSDDFQVQAKLVQWENETNFSVRLKHTEKNATIETDGDKIKWKGNKVEAHFYNVEKTKDLPKAFELEVLLLEKPETNKVEFTTQSKGLKFYKQPPLTEEFKSGYSEEFKKEIIVTETDVKDLDGNVLCHRPIEVVNSYAVYHESKQGDYSKMGKKNYRAGKAFHIYRPKIIDSAGTEVWGELNITDNLLTVEIPQEFLDNAVYPIRIDPEFGYHTIGGSSLSTYNKIIGGNYAGSAGTVSMISFYGRRSYADSRSKAALYKKSDYSLQSPQSSHISVPVDNAWNDHTLTPSITAIDYIIAIWLGYWNSHIYYDTDAGWGKEYYKSYSSNDNSDPANWNAWPDPLTEGSAGNGYGGDRKFSIYCTYTAGGAGNLKSVNGVAFADIKSKNSVAIANIKSINGVTTS